MITLALETSTVRGSVALLRDDRPIDEQVFQRAEPKENLFRSVEKLLEQHQVGIDQVDLVAVGVGPGSFTGIRAGLAAAQGLALPRSLPIKTANSFDALALTVAPRIPPDCPQLCVVGDARREEIYYAIYDRDGRPVRPCRIAPLEQVADEIHAPLWFVSAEIDRFADDLGACLGGFASVHPEPVFPSASAVGWLAQRRFRDDNRQGDTRLEPVYLREVQYRKNG